MKNLLYRLTPYFRLSSNPLFALDTRHFRRGSAPSLLRYSFRLVLVVCAIVLVLWLLLILPYATSGYLRVLGYSTSLNFAILVGGLSLLAGFALDFASMSYALGSISGEITAGRWELLRLTMLSSKQIVAAKYGVAQVRAWRLMILLVAVRLASVLLFALSMGIVRLVDQRIFSVLPFFVFLLLLLGTGGAALLYITEPFLRMRTVTALGVAASARARQPLSTVLVAVGTVAAFWLGQGFVAGGLLLGVGVIITPLAALEAALNQGVIFSPLLFVVICAVTVFGFYSIVQTWALRRAERFAARLD